MRFTGWYEPSRFKYHYETVLGKMLQPKAKTLVDRVHPYLRAANVLEGRIDTDDLKTMWFSPSEIIKYDVKPGDLLILEGGDVGRGAILDSAMPNVGFQNSIHRVRPLPGNSNRFALYWFNHLKSAGYFDLISSKATLAHFTGEKVKETPFPKVDLLTQKRIADFLDRETARIDQLIEKKQRLVGLLEEKRSATITAAVTRGLSPDVSMRDSGVEWLGEVPEHWRVFALKRLAGLKSGNSITADSIEECGEYPVFGGNGLRGYTSSYTHEGSYVLIGRQGALCGNVNYTQGRFFASEHAVVVSPVRPVVTIWLGELLRAMNLNQHSMSAAQPGLSVEVIGNIRIPVPPLPEQLAIAGFLGREITRIDAIQDKTNKSIEILKEFRSAIITAAVTGQIGVEAWGGRGDTDRHLDTMGEELSV